MTAAKHICMPRRLSAASSFASSDRLKFFRAWTANPLQVASIIPSGSELSELITSEISSSTGPVIELGPGTGVFTRSLLRRGVKEGDLTLIEYGSDFAAMLRTRFPEASVLRMDAQDIGQIQRREGQPVGAVISGLPLLSMRTRSVMAILGGSFRLMGSGGKFYQFTYGPRCPIPRRILDRLGLKAVHIGWAPLNIPPASVYRITKRRALI
jgi:phosphatidylethanolamine/phosphatidyl-N-methylethanolamine N-methyltransferase